MKTWKHGKHSPGSEHSLSVPHEQTVAEDFYSLLESMEQEDQYISIPLVLSLEIRYAGVARREDCMIW